MPSTDLEAVADRLYALKPDDFAAARDAEVRSARAAGQQPLARDIAKLRRPTQSAWLINLLWRDQHDVMEQLFELAQELARAQAAAAGPELRELTAQRRQLENALMRRAVELGSEAGVRVSDSVAREAQATLRAALAVPDVADEVRSGRLLKAASYAGFGGAAAGRLAPRPSTALIDLDAVRQRRAAGAGQGDALEPAPADEADPRRTQGQGTRGEAARDEDERDTRGQAARDEQGQDTRGHAARQEEERRKRAEEEAEARRRAEKEREEQERRRLAAERRAAAERQLAQARRDAQRASTALADATRAAQDAQDRARDLRQQVETLQRQLARVEPEAQRADAAAAEADAQREQANAASAQAGEAVSAAEQELSSASDPTA